jgi:hypothetical protein
MELSSGFPGSFAAFPTHSQRCSKSETANLYNRSPTGAFMHLRYCHLVIAATLLASAPAAGQGFQPVPSQGFTPPPAQAHQQEPPCIKDFSKLRAETEKRGKAVQEAGKRKVSPQEACRLFNALMAAEAKLIKYTEDNAKWCGIPPQVPKQLQEGHARVKQVRDRVCNLAARPARPAGPSLSDALGTSRTPDSSNIRTGKGGGTFDTLTGSPLAK